MSRDQRIINRLLEIRTQLETYIKRLEELVEKKRSPEIKRCPECNKFFDSEASVLTDACDSCYVELMEASNKRARR